MKVLLFIMCLSLQAFAHTDEGMPLIKVLGPKLSKTRFKAVISVMHEHFKDHAAQNSRKLEFYTDYNADWAQAFARRWETDQVHVYGGLAAVPGVTEDSFALVLCHELGHLYGGEPFSDAYNRLAVEGQADYWATLKCFKDVVLDLTPRTPSEEGLWYCDGETLCARGMDAALVMTSFFADNRSMAHPRFDTPDVAVVVDVLKTHPEPQCRLDTYMSGLHTGKRPLCWMPEEVANGRVP